MDHIEHLAALFLEYKNAKLDETREFLSSRFDEVLKDLKNEIAKIETARSNDQKNAAAIIKELNKRPRVYTDDEINEVLVSVGLPKLLPVAEGIGKLPSFFGSSSSLDGVAPDLSPQQLAERYYGDSSHQSTQKADTQIDQPVAKKNGKTSSSKKSQTKKAKKRKQ